MPSRESDIVRLLEVPSDGYPGVVSVLVSHVEVDIRTVTIVGLVFSSTPGSVGFGRSVVVEETRRRRRSVHPASLRRSRQLLSTSPDIDVVCIICCSGIGSRGCAVLCPMLLAIAVSNEAILPLMKLPIGVYLM